jgi:hypothetical protein
VPRLNVLVALLSPAGERLLQASKNRVPVSYCQARRRDLIRIKSARHPGHTPSQRGRLARPFDDAVGIPEQVRKEELIMKKLLTLSALAFALMATPALARCTVTPHRMVIGT